MTTAVVNFFYLGFKETEFSLFFFKGIHNLKGGIITYKSKLLLEKKGLSNASYPEE